MRRRLKPRYDTAASRRRVLLSSDLFLSHLSNADQLCYTHAWSMSAAAISPAGDPRRRWSPTAQELVIICRRCLADQRHSGLRRDMAVLIRVGSGGSNYHSSVLLHL